MGDSYGGDRALEKLLAAAEEEGKTDKVEAPLAYSIFLTDGQTGCGGPAIVTQLDEAQCGWRLEVDLGPRNMRRLIAFLQALPEEPDEDGDGHRIGVMQGATAVWAWVERAPDLVVKPERLQGLQCRETIHDDHGDKFPALYVGPFEDYKQAWEWLDRALRGVTP